MNQELGPNKSFLIIMLQMLRRCEIEDEDPIEMIPCVIEGIKTGKITGCKGVDPKLMNNFESGWDSAIEKYGADVAPDRMKEYLIKKLIETSTGLTREDLLQIIDRSWFAASLIVKGIHLTKDEEGNYYDDNE